MQAFSFSVALNTFSFHYTLPTEVISGEAGSMSGLSEITRGQCFFSQDILSFSLQELNESVMFSHCQYVMVSAFIFIVLHMHWGEVTRGTFWPCSGSYTKCLVPGTFRGAVYRDWSSKCVLMLHQKVREQSENSNHQLTIATKENNGKGNKPSPSEH